MTDDSTDIDWDDTSDKDLESKTKPTQAPRTNTSTITSTPATKPKGQLGVIARIAGPHLRSRYHYGRAHDRRRQQPRRPWLCARLSHGSDSQDSRQHSSASQQTSPGAIGRRNSRTS